MQREKQELQKQLQEAAAMQAESRLERGLLSFVLLKAAHILRLDRSYMLEEGLQSLQYQLSAATFASQLSFVKHYTLMVPCPTLFACRLVEML